MQRVTRRYASLGTLLLALSIGLAMALDYGTEARILNDTNKRYGNEAAGRIKQWFKVMHLAASMKETEKLRVVNSFFNTFPNVDDMAHWGVPDYWATPLELIGTNGGDYEDFAIAKYFTLRDLGIADERLRLTYVKAYVHAIGRVQSHMVLSYYPAPDSEPLVLDSLINAIKPASQRADLTPIYSVNAAGLWSSKERDAGRRISDTDTLPAWRDVRTQMLRLDGTQ